MTKLIIENLLRELAIKYNMDYNDIYFVYLNHKDMVLTDQQAFMYKKLVTLGVIEDE